MSASYLSKTKNSSEIKQKAFVVLLIKRRVFSGTPGTYPCCFRAHYFDMAILV